MLCRLLAATQVAGYPDSHFHAETLAPWLDSFHLDKNLSNDPVKATKMVFHAAKKKGTGATHLFGLRLQGQSRTHFLYRLKQVHPDVPTDLARIETEFGPTCFIHLSRTDKLRQAASLVKAAQTGLWHKAPDGTEIERSASQGKIKFDPDAISKELTTVTSLDAAWNTWFLDQKIDPIRITYEDFAKNPLDHIARLLNTLGMDSALAQGPENTSCKISR